MPDQFKGLHYRLRCVGCGQIFHDNDGMMPLGCDAAHPPASQQIVVLNLTGGGRVKAEREFKIRSAVPDLLVSRSDSSSICDKIESLSGSYAA